MLSNDWVLYNGSWYLFSEEKRPWWEAEEACGSLGAHLASVTSQKEMVSKLPPPPFKHPCSCFPSTGASDSFPDPRG